MPGRESVAIDGPVASGKTAVGRRLAQRLGYRFLDTGAMYRAFTWAAVNRDVDPDDWESQARLAGQLRIRLVPGDDGNRLFVDDQDVTDHLRSPEVERNVSLFSRVPGVRAALVEQQRAVAREGPIVMAGRDIGTVVLVDAEVKVFLDASVEVRARRRFRELESGGGERPDIHRVREELERRDMIDTEREDSPLRPANDAVRIDTDCLETEEVVDSIMSFLGRG